jgi:2-methylcitrate dehydratase PrpD
VLDAIVAGYEVGGRLGMACRIRPGMHVDGTWGSFASAISACHLAATTTETAMAALNHVACHMPFSLYWPIPSGSTARNAYAGHGAAHGLAAAVAGMAGLGGPAGSIGEMLRLALGADPEQLPDFPGPDRWLLLEGYLKPYPAVRHVHYGAAAAEAWRAAHASPDAITAIRLRVYPEAITYCGNRHPTTAIQAQFSLSYGVARSLAAGRLDPAAYGADSLADPLVRRLEAMVELQADPEAAGRRGCVLEVATGDDVWRLSVDGVPGDPGMPMTRAQVREKFGAYAGPVIGASHADAIADRLLDLPLATPLHLQHAA